MKNKLIAGVGVPVGMLVLIFLILFFVNLKIEYEAKKETESQVAQVLVNEQKYLEGINLVKQEKWYDAGVNLVLLKQQNYKDSKILYDYANAKAMLESKYRDIRMASYYVSNVPDDYNGVFADDILSFKKEVIQENNNTTDEDIRQQELEYAREQGLFDIEIISFKWHRSSNSFVTAKGQIRNLSDNSLNILAIVTYKTKNEAFITYDSALIEYTPLLAGQTSPFEIITPYNPEMASATIEFSKHNGGKLRADYSFAK